MDRSMDVSGLGLSSVLDVSLPWDNEPDPSTRGGFSLVYKRDVPLEIRGSDGIDLPADVSALEAITVKILERRESSLLRGVRVELSSEANLWFLYVHELDQGSFHDLQDQQKLMLDFNDYPQLLLRMLNSCIRDPAHFVGLLVMQPGMRARLDFMENLDYKWIEHLSAPLEVASEAAIRESIVYRYNKMKAVTVMLQQRLTTLATMVKGRNPGLLLQFRDIVQNGGTPTSPRGARRTAGVAKPGGKLPDASFNSTLGV
ncbi:unnamed protein product [Pedinophyceae sp. YPF-701]|nr:unnamed protein product [Pedinophyceae sp. YPF-701]